MQVYVSISTRLADKVSGRQCSIPESDEEKGGRGLLQSVPSWPFAELLLKKACSHSDHAKQELLLALTLPPNGLFWL